MADDTRSTRTGFVPGAIKTGSDGSVPDTGHRRAWVWMQDTPDGGGGRFDVLSHRVDLWVNKGAKVVPNYPLHFGPSGRLAKTSAQIGGTPSGSGQPPAPPELRLPAHAVGAVEPADQDSSRPDGDVEDLRLSDARPDGDVEDTRIDTVPPADAGEPTDQAAGEPAADTTKSRRGGRTR